MVKNKRNRNSIFKVMKRILSVAVLMNAFSVYAQEKTWSLSDCIDYAVNHDLYLKETAMNSDLADKEITAAYGRLLPAASAYADNQYNFGSVIDPTTNARVSSDIRSNSLSFSSNIELFNWGNFIRIQSAKLQKEKSVYDLEVRKNELVIKIVQAYNQIQYDREQIALLEKQLANSEITLNQIQLEFELGNKAKSDVYELQANKASEEQMLVTAQNALKTSETALANLLNLEEIPEFGMLEASDEGILGISLDELFAFGIQNRPEIKSAELQNKIAEKEIKQQKSAYYPTLNGNYSLSSFYVDTETSALADQFRNNKNHYLGVSVSVPIFNRLQTKTAVQKAKIEQEQSLLQLEQQKQAYYNALRDAVNFAQNAAQNREAAQKNVVAQEISFARTEDKFKLGMIDAYAYFAAKNSLLAAQSALLQAEFNYNYQLILLKFYLTNEVL